MILGNARTSTGNVAQLAVSATGELSTADAGTPNK
jgi:hypothetical protein